MRILPLLLLLSLLHATPLDDKIKALKNAPVEERFKLMNAIKKEIAAMHQKERLEAIKKLQKDLDNNQSIKKDITQDTKIKIENQAQKTISNTIDNYQFQGGNYHDHD